MWAATGYSTPSESDYVDDEFVFSTSSEALYSSVSPVSFYAINVKYDPHASVYKMGTNEWAYNIVGTYQYDVGDKAYFKFPVPPSGYYYKDLYYSVSGSDLPSPGTYGVQWSFYEANIALDFLSSNVDVWAGKPNVSSDCGSVFGTVTSDGFCRGNCQIGYNTQAVNLMVNLSSGGNIVRDLDIIVPRNNAYIFTFKHQDADTAVSPDVSNGSGSASAFIGSAVGAISNTVSSIDDGIREVVQTISFQLTAFWDQLAGEFTNLYGKMDTQHEEDLNAVEDQTDDITDNADKNTNIITGALEKLGNFLIEGLKSLFIPSDEFFKTWFDDIYSFFNNRFGIFMFPFDIFIRLCNLYLSAGSGSPVFPFPEFTWLDGTVIIPEQSVEFTFLDTDFGRDIQSKLHFVSTIIIIGAFLNLLYHKFDEVMKG